VNIPLAGHVRAVGLTQNQLEKAIEQKLVEAKIFRWPTATINVLPDSRAVTVGGSVRTPTRIPYER
jgi:protein involved in polysaccharide export with SLBB domain